MKLKNKFDKFPGQQVLETMHVDQGMTLSDIARHFNVGKSTVTSWMNRAGIKITRKVVAFEIDRDQLYDLYITQNLAARAIANKYNVATSTVMKQLKRHKIEIRTGADRNKTVDRPLVSPRNVSQTNPQAYSKLNDRVWLRNIAIKQMISFREIGRQLNVSEALIHKYVNGHKLDILLERYRSFVLFSLAKQYITNKNVRYSNLINKVGWVRPEMITPVVLSLGGEIRHTSDYDDISFNKQSRGELEVLNFIEQNYDGEIISGFKMPIEGRRKEIDIVVPEFNLAIEFNGMFYHCEQKGFDRNRHLEKQHNAKSCGLNLMYIWEDDWKNRKQIVQSQLLHKLGKSKSIYARKCVIYPVSGKQSTLFLNENHIQGSAPASHKYGLFYEDKLVALATFSYDHNKNFVLSRYCNILNHNIVGGLSKLIKYFMKKHPEIDQIKSQSHNDWYNGSGYNKAGFEFLHVNPPTYWYVDRNKFDKQHRSTYNKANIIKKFGLSEQMKNKTETELMNYVNSEKLMLLRIWNCGTTTWIYKRKGGH